jgi:hypothetical protein
MWIWSLGDQYFHHGFILLKQTRCCPEQLQVSNNDKGAKIQYHVNPNPFHSNLHQFTIFAGWAKVYLPLSYYGWLFK